MSKKIKIFKAFHAYDNYLTQFYQKNSPLKNSSYESQRLALVNDAFPWIYTWSTNNEDKDAFIFETVHNCEPLQKAWRGKKNFGEDWQLNIVLEQIREIKPDVCVLYPPSLFNHEVIENIRSSVGHKMMIGGYDGMDRKDITVYSGYDFIITCSEYISKFYKANGFLTYTLNFGFDESILNRINTNAPVKHTIGFSGSIYPYVHDSRYSFLRKVTRNQLVTIRSEFGLGVDYGLFSKNQLKRLLKQMDIQNYFGLWRVTRNNTGPVYGLEMYQFLHDSKISLNMHGDRIGFAANVRMYEITGVGSCMLTDWKENIAEIFEPDKEIVVYKSAEEASDKARFLLKNEKTRTSIAKAGQRRTLDNYTYKRTIPKLIQFIKEQI